jgi:hypothetical protein
MSTAVVASQVPQVEASSSGKLDWHIVLESLTDGQVAASIAELPDCKVVAGSRNEAIAAVRLALNERLGAIEVVPIELNVTIPEHPIMKFVGILRMTLALLLGQMNFGLRSSAVMMMTKFYRLKNFCRKAN